MNAYCVQYTHKTFIQPVHDACRAAGGAVNTPNIINNSVNSKNVGMHISIHSEPIIIIIKISSTNKVWKRRRKNRCCHSVLSLFDVTAFEPNRWCVCVAQMNALYAHNKIGVDLIDFFSLFFCSILIPFRRISNLLAFDSLASLYHSPFRPLPPQTNTCSTDTTSFRFTDLISWHRSIEYHPNEISL